VPAWRLSRVLGWSTGALFGDPVLVLVPPFILIALMLGAFAIGAPGRPEVLLPLVSLPPIDSFSDVVVIDVGAHGDVATWILRALALAVRTVAFGLLLRLAVQRAREEIPSLGAAAAFVRRRFTTIAFLELCSFAIFGVSLSLGADLTSSRDDGAIGTALLFGVAILIGMFVAASSGDVPAGAAVRAGLRRLWRRPLEHFGLVIAYGAASNGLYRLASIGELNQRSVPVTLYAFASSLLTMWFVLAFVRRQLTLDASETAENSGR